MTDPHPHHRLAVGARRPGLAHIISTACSGDAARLRLLIVHAFDPEPPALRERFARRDTPDVIIELSQN